MDKLLCINLDAEHFSPFYVKKKKKKKSKWVGGWISCIDCINFRLQNYKTTEKVCMLKLENREPVQRSDKIWEVGKYFSSKLQRIL